MRCLHHSQCTWRKAAVRAGIDLRTSRPRCARAQHPEHQPPPAELPNRYARNTAHKNKRLAWSERMVPPLKKAMSAPSEMRITSANMEPAGQARWSKCSGQGRVGRLEGKSLGGQNQHMACPTAVRLQPLSPHRCWIRSAARCQSAHPGRCVSTPAAHPSWCLQGRATS